MASGHRHWRARLAALNALPALRRPQKRQLRKLLGRRLGQEWRIFGNTRGGIAVDPLNTLIATRAKTVGHVGDWWREQQA